MFCFQWLNFLVTWNTFKKVVIETVVLSSLDLVVSVLRVAVEKIQTRVFHNKVCKNISKQLDKNRLATLGVSEMKYKWCDLNKGR